MNTQTQEALKMAELALDVNDDCECSRSYGIVTALTNALIACKEALAQPAITDEKGRPMTYWGGLAQPSWQGLSDDEIDALKKMEMKTLSEEATEFARAIEQALKERNT